MVATADNIRKAFREIPEGERADLIDKLILDLHGGSSGDDEWMEEVEGRCREIDEGKVQLLTWEEVQENLRKRVEQRG